MNPIDPSLVINEVRNALAARTSRRVGDTKAPPDRALPYHIVYPMPGGSLSGSWGEPFEDAVVVVQVSAVGGTREQAQHALWIAETMILGRVDGKWGTAFGGDGWKVSWREPDSDGGVEPDDDANLFTASARYRLHIVRVPAA